MIHEVCKLMKENKMVYNRPAEEWSDAIPMGNGRLGAMVYGHTAIDRMQLNDDSLWYGGFIDRNNRSTLHQLANVRAKIMAGEIEDAEDLLSRYFVGAPNTMRHYETLGEVDIALNQKTPFTMGWLPNSLGAEEYCSELDLMRGIHTVTHIQEGVRYTREMFCSYPHQVFCLRLSCDRLGAVNLNVQLDRCAFGDKKALDSRRPGVMIRGDAWGGMLLDENHTLDARTLVSKGHAAETGFACAVRMVTDGEQEDPYTQMATRNATTVCLFIASSTTNRMQDCTGDALNRVSAAETFGFEALKREHIADFEEKMRRCTLDLGSPSAVSLDCRLQEARNGKKDNNLVALYFMFGRYLLLSSGRENSAALNLQGVWCKDFIPAWDCKYTVNINEQMNYWPSEVCNLSETHQSLFWLLRRMEERGRDTARIMYGCRGSVCHHNTDFYGDCAPQDSYMAATSWVMGGAWLSLHLWEHYQYTGDLDFLREWYPVLHSFALFFLDFLVDDGTGKLVTCPSLSPENRYILPDGLDTPICAGPTMDNQILRALFNVCIQSDELLGLNDPSTPSFLAAQKRLPENKIGSKGQLLEWQKEVPELTPGMDHISHLWGVFPGTEINWKDTPDLLKAAHTSLSIRCEHGCDHGQWPLAWICCQYARMLDRERAGKAIRKMVSISQTRNFFNGKDVFQIDGNLGTTAGIAEVLLQSHTGIIHLLPALPPDWDHGEVKGLVARGGCVVDMRWENGQLQKASLHVKRSGKLEVRAECQHLTLNGKVIAIEATLYGFRFAAEAGETYRLD